MVVVVVVVVVCVCVCVCVCLPEVNAPYCNVDATVLLLKRFADFTKVTNSVTLKGAIPAVDRCAEIS